MLEVTKRQFANGLVWKSVNLFLTRGISIMLSIILSRILEPENFGLMTIWSVVLSFGNVLVIGGIDVVLVQQKDTQADDFSTAGIVCLGRAAILFLFTFIFAPVFSLYYESELLGKLIRVTGIEFFCQAVIVIYTARATRQIAFKKLFFADFFATIIGGGCALFLLYLNYPTWVLIANIIIRQLVYAFLLYMSDRKIYSFTFNKEKFWSITRRGYKVMANGLFDLITGSITGLSVGKIWIASEVGYYNRAEKLTQTFGVETYNIISGILLPTFSSYQQDKEKLKAISRKLTSMSFYIMFPLMLGLAMCSKELVIVLLTEKWLPAVLLIKLSCINNAMNPIRQLSMQLNYSVGRYKINNKIECCRLLLMLLAIIVIAFLKTPKLYLISIAFGIVAIITATTYLLSLKKSINYSPKEIFFDLFPIVMISFVSMIPIYILKQIKLLPILFLIISIPVAIAIYVGLSAYLKLDVFCYVRSSLKTLLHKKGE